MAEEIDPAVTKAALDKLINDSVNGDRRIDIAVKLIAALRSAIGPDVRVPGPRGGSVELNEYADKMLPFITGEKLLAALWEVE
jgi:hypothetical protein